MKRIGFTLISLFIFSVSLLAQGRHMGGGNCSSCLNVVGRFTRANIELTDEQTDTITSIYHIANTKIIDLSAKRRATSEYIRLEISKKDVDRTKLKKLIMDKNNIEGLIEFERVGLDLDILDVLTEEQRSLMKMHHKNSGGKNKRHNGTGSMKHKGY